MNEPQSMPAASAALPPLAVPPRTSTLAATLSGLLVILALALAWGTRAPNSDLFMALDGGRDVVDGKLNKPDDWSFVTKDRVWINQSWLSGWALFRIWRASGETGLLVTRGVLLALLAGGLVAWLRGRGTSWAAACTAAALVLVAARVFLTLRGNLVTVVAAPWLFWLLDRHRRGSIHWTWAIALLLAVWTHCHGGFVYGLGVLLLWLVFLVPSGGLVWAALIACVVAGLALVTVAQIVVWPLRGDALYALGALLLWLLYAHFAKWERRSLTAGRWAALVACFIAVTVLPILVGPFGVNTFKQSFTMAGRTEWRTIREWWPTVRIPTPATQPVHGEMQGISWQLHQALASYKADWDEAFWEVGSFPLLLGLTLILAIVAGIGRIRRGRRSEALPTSEPSGGDANGAVASPIAPLPALDWSHVLFDIGILVVSVTMAFTGRRFAPLGAVAVALPLAFCLDGVWRRIDAGVGVCASRIGPLGGLCILTMTTLLAAANYPTYALGYSASHPFYPPQSVFARQVMANAAPHAAARFMRVNHVTGNVVHEYGSEAYLRWAVPDIKVFCGGRAQQIYDETDLKRLRAFLDQRFLMPAMIQVRNQRFFDFNVKAVVFPTASLWDLSLALSDSRVWLPVFCDGDFVVLIRTVSRTVNARGEPTDEFAPTEEFKRYAAGRLERAAVALIDPAGDPTEDAARAAAASGKIVFPDETAYLYSRALLLTSPWLTGGDAAMTPQRRAEMDEFLYTARREAIEQALHHRPHPRLYDLLERLARQRPEPRPDLGPFFKQELDRLGKLPVTGADSSDLLRCRIALLDALKRRAKDAGEDEEAKALEEQARRALVELTELARWWQF